MKTLEIIVLGKVQGVWFRKFTKQKANQLGVFGTVQNLSDSSVKIIASAETDIIDDFIAWCHHGSPKSKVESVEVKQIDSKSFHSFEIIH